MSDLLRARLLLLAGAIVLGLVFQHLLGAWLDEIVERSKVDMLAARADLAWLIRSVGAGVFGLTGALGAAMAHACRAPGVAERFPPPGLMSLGARHVITGPTARVMTGVGLGLGLVLLVASLAGAALVWYMGAVLLACRA
jgi:hypothetical protein